MANFVFNYLVEVQLLVKSQQSSQNIVFCHKLFNQSV